MKFMNKNFVIEGLGELEFVVTLIESDHPVSFVAKKVNSDSIIFIFDEYDFDQDSVTWICSQISIDDLDKLNRGLKTFNSCFLGPRNSPKSGYIVNSRRGNEHATSTQVSDLTNYLAETDIFIPQFVEDNHGAEVISLITKKVYLSLVLDSDKYADPFINFTNLKEKIENSRAFLNSLPFKITVKDNRTYLTNEHSIVVNFEISDKVDKKANSKQCLIEEVETALRNKESDATIDSINSAMNCKNGEELAYELQNDSLIINKFEKFINSFRKNEKEQLIQLVSPNKKTKQIKINNDAFNQLTKITGDARKIVENCEFKKTEKTVSGYFEMFDIKGDGKFRLVSPIDQTEYQGKISNTFNIKDSPVEIKDSTSTYSVVLEIFHYESQKQEAKPIYILKSIKKHQNPTQLLLIDNN